MIRINTFKLAAVAAVVIASTVSAQETQTSTAEVTITNAFDLTETTALKFGTIRATQVISDGTTTGTGTDLTPTQANGAGIRIKSDGTPTEAISAATVVQGGDADVGTGTIASNVSVILAGEPGEYAIANAAPFTNLRVTDPDETGAELTNPSAPATSKFDLTIDLADMTVIGGGNNNDTVTGSNLLTDSAGSVALRVGGELTIGATATSMPDGLYSGTYTIEVSY